MNRNIYSFAILVITLLSSQAVFADIKIKSKQTMSRQSYENTTYIKGKRSRAETMNGMMINITQCDLRRGVQINPNAKTYMVNPFAQTTQTTRKTTAATTDKSDVVQTGGKITTTITTKDTGERKQMFGYTARHLIITMETESSPDACNKTTSKMQTDGWYIDFEAQFDCDYGQNSYNYNSNRSGGCQDKYDIKQVGTAKRGYPVYEKMTMFDESGKETMSMVAEVVELSKATLDAGLFDVPTDYREVSDASQMYGAASYSSVSAGRSNSMQLPNGGASTSSANGTSQVIKNAAASSSGNTATIEPKKAGTVRIGLAAVKTGSVGDGITAADLAAAVQNTLIQYLKVPNVEVVTIDARLSTAVENEAVQRECDYVVYSNVSHKKGGGGGFGGMFGSALGSAIGHVGIGHTGSTVGNIAGQVATQAIVSAGQFSSNFKSKDEITLDLKLNKIGGAAAFAKVYKAKAKSDGDDIITQIIEQAAQSIVDTVGR